VTTDDRIHVFKYGSSSCDFEFFDDKDEATEYVVQVPPTEFFRVVVNGDEPELL
jgi:hypothetical protein